MRFITNFHKKRFFSRANLVIALCFTTIMVHGQPKELTLEECRELARENNQQVKIANQHSQAASALREASYTKFFPGFDFTGSYLRTNKEFSILDEDMLLPVVPVSAIGPDGQVDTDRLLDHRFHPENVGVIFDNEGNPRRDPDGNPLFHSYTWLPDDQLSFGSQNNFLLNVGMTQPIYTGGKTRSQYRMTSHIETMAKEGEKLELSEVLYETEKLYWKVYSLQEKLELATSYHSLLENMVEDLSNLYEEGIVSQNELLKARVKLNEANLDRIKARNGLELAKKTLCHTIGLPISTEIEVRDTLWVSDELDPLDDLFHNAMEKRPEIQMASTGVDLGESVVDLARARFMPNIALSANYFMAKPDPYHGFSNQFGRDWNVGIIMRIPIFHWGERKHILNVAKHEKRAQEIKLEDAKELVKLEINKIFYEINEAREKVNITELSLEQAEENLELAEDNFEVGRIATTELLEAQTLWREAYSNNIEAKSDLKLQQTNMQKAIGELINE